MLTTAEIYRRALVIGNSGYEHAQRLKNPVNDADVLGARLQGLGFEVHVEKNLNADGFRRAISELCRDLGNAGQAGKATSGVLFYAGHGVQVDGENYLLPVDADIQSKLDLKQQSVQLDVVLEAIGSVARTGVVLLDCCRNNPLPQTLGPAQRSLAQSHGLANVKAPKGVYVAFSTQPHFVALDGTGNNSPFTEALSEHVDDRGKHVSEMMMAVRRDVYDKTGGQQIPWDHSALFEPFAFAPGEDPTRGGLSEEEWEKQSKAEAKAREDSYWQIVKTSKDVDVVRSFVSQFPNSEHRKEASDRIEALIVSRRRRQAIPWIAASIAGLILLVGAITWFRMQPMSDTDIIGGDMEQDNGLQGFDASEIGCRLSCLADRFDHPCVAYSYDEKNKRCYPKFEAVFFEKPSKTSKDPVHSEIMPGHTKPTESSFIMHWDRALAGTPTQPTEVEKAPGSTRNLVEDVDTKRSYWVVKSGGECQKLCTDLGSYCRGFSFTRLSSRCELFETVRGLMRDSVNRVPVFIPGMFSGFTACVDRTNPECEKLPIGGPVSTPASRAPAPGGASPAAPVQVPAPVPAQSPAPKQ